MIQMLTLLSRKLESFITNDKIARDFGKHPCTKNCCHGNIKSIGLWNVGKLLPNIF